MEIRQRRPLSTDELASNVDSLVKEVEALDQPDNSQRRNCHLRLELLRLEISEYLESHDDLSDEAKAMLDALDKRVEAADSPLSLKVKLQRGILVYINGVALLIYVFLVAMPLMWIVVPLRVTHPMLRWLGLKNNYLPVDWTIKWFAQAFMLFSGVKLVVHWDPELEISQNYVAMFTHSSNLDPYITQAGSPISFKWIGKKQLFRIPVFGWLMTAQGHFPVDRANRQRAIESLDSAARAIHAYHRSIAIAPEGTRSRNGQLLPFKKGPFHTTAKVSLPVLPVVIYNAYERWPPGQVAPTPGTVVVKYLKPITFPKDMEPRALVNPVRRVFLEEMLSASNVPPPLPGTTFQAVRGVLLNMVMLAVPYLYYLALFAPRQAS